MKTRRYKGNKFIKYGKGWIDPEDHGGLTGKPTVWYSKKNRSRKRSFRRKKRHSEGKTYVDVSGYIRFKGSGKLLHRWLAYKYIFKPNKHEYSYRFSSYQVHHKDGNKLNNDISNLQIITDDAHRQIHGIPEPERTGCFIATAAYGTPYAQEINILRIWRDNYLQSKKLGKIFIKFYYKHSPPIANFISDNALLRKIVRISLKPIILFFEKIYKK